MATTLKRMMSAIATSETMETSETIMATIETVSMKRFPAGVALFQRTIGVWRAAETKEEVAADVQGGVIKHHEPRGVGIPSAAPAATDTVGKMLTTDMLLERRQIGVI